MQVASSTASPLKPAGRPSTAPARSSQSGASAGQAPGPSAVVSISAQAHALSAVSSAAASPARATAPDATSPTLVAFSPSRNATNVNPRSKLSFTFSEQIAKGAGVVSIKDAGGNVVESFDLSSSSQVSVSGRRLVIDPTDALLDASTQYFVSLESGNVKDLAGNLSAADSSYAFTTAADRTAPRVTSFSPAARAKDVALDANISYNFSEAVTFGSGTILLKNADGDTVESFDVATSRNISLSNDGKTLVIDPTKNLASNVTYSVVMAKGSMQDRHGNSFAGTTNTFTTERKGFNIDLVYSGATAYKKYFSQAKTILERVITADLPDLNGVDDLKITATVANIDGVGRILGQATPTVLRQDSRLPTLGSMKFDTADMASMAANGTLGGVILHEMTHVLGVGSLWNMFGLNRTVGQYTGANGIKAYQDMTGDSSKTYVPLETTGGPGTANVHWSEATFRSELMTGMASGGMELSRLSIAALADLGYKVDESQAAPYTLPAA